MAATPSTEWSQPWAVATPSLRRHLSRLSQLEIGLESRHCCMVNGWTASEWFMDNEWLTILSNFE